MRYKTIFTTLDSAVVRGALCVVVWATAVHESRAAETPFNIDRLDPRFDQLVPKDAKLEKIADGFTWVEGPVWHKQGGICSSRIFLPTTSTNGNLAKA